MRIGSDIKDDRGSRVSALKASAIRGEDSAAAARRELVSRLRTGVRGVAFQDLMMQLLIVLFAILGCTGGVAAGAVLSGGGLGVTAGGIVFCAAMTPAWIIARRRAARAVAGSAVAEGFCGSCAYSLEGLAEESDGCVCCGECGAAWNALRIRVPHWDPRSEQVIEAAESAPRDPRNPRPMAFDARGRFVKGVEGGVSQLPSATVQGLRPEQLASIRREIWRAGTPQRVVGVVILAIVFALPIVAIALNGGLSGWESLVVILLIVAIPITLLWWFSASTSGESVARVLGEHGVCGCCGSLLAGREPEADGCTVCANCRAAWRVAPPAGARGGGGADA
jgi:hypothetical protein